MTTMEKQNRAERRKNKFGGGRAAEQGGWPTVQPNPVFGGADAPEEAPAGAPDQDQTRETGPGTGGATKQAGRATRHEGTHAGNSTKG
jgi:hypothetical protein